MMKEKFIVHRPIDDNPEIPDPYSNQRAEKSSLTKSQTTGTKWIRDMRDEPEKKVVSVSDELLPTKPIQNREEPFYMLRKEWSRLRRENMITLLGQMYEDDGKESTDAFLLEAIRSF